jgi:tRNA A37 N6-isopentenylltransferase MiaA
MQGIGYKETIEYIEGRCDLEKLEENLRKNTHHLAKKQRTRFRRYIAEGKAAPKKNVTYKVFEL